MTTETARLQALIRTIIEKFIDYPSSLMIEPKEQPGMVYWTIKGHADDQSKLVGKQGAHYQAMLVIIAELGNALETQYILKRYLEPDPAPRRDSMQKKTVTQYDPAEAEELLIQILTSIAVGEFAVNTIPLSPTAFTFSIITPARADYNLLTVASEKRTNPMTLIGAIGTIFRAYANREGVRFNLEVRQA